MPGWISIQGLEIIFVMIALFGFVFSFMNLRRAQRVVNRLKQMELRNGRLRLAVFGRNQEAARFLIQTIFIAIGLAAMILPPNGGAPLPLSWEAAAFIIRYGLIAVAVIVSYKSYVQWSFQRTFKLDKDSSNYDDV